MARREPSDAPGLSSDVERAASRAAPSSFVPWRKCACAILPPPGSRPPDLPRAVDVRRPFEGGERLVVADGGREQPSQFLHASAAEGSLPTTSARYSATRYCRSASPGADDLTVNGGGVVIGTDADETANTGFDDRNIGVARRRRHDKPTTIQNGRAIYEYSSAVYNQGTLNLTRSTVRNNTAVGIGAIYGGGTRVPPSPRAP